MTHRSASSFARRLTAFCSCLSLLAAADFSAEASKQRFNIPAEKAEKSLKLLSVQSGRQVLFPTDAVEGIRTKSVTGEMTAADALGKMLEGTLLLGIEDDQTGSLTVRRRAASNASGKSTHEPSEATRDPSGDVQKKTNFRHRKTNNR